MEWYKDDDLLKLNELSIASNTEDWESAKNCFNSDEKFEVFFVDTEEGYAGLNIEDAKQLAKYLIEKIEYVEGVPYESNND